MAMAGVRKKTFEERFWSKVKKSDPDKCWEWTATFDKRSGYGKISTTKHRNMAAHRASYEIHNSSIDNTLCVLHKCDNPTCVNPDHLFLGTKQDNNLDKLSKGRAAGPKGTNNKSAKLTEADILVIRAMIDNKISDVAIAKQFNVYSTTIRMIRLRKTWNHI